ncbi:uncharacterized protein BCR38DRAFT_239728 [Pseudomassariella vexata]|uniref:Uncharacterized protein n=1 Tax=Pseudomassariella vexata TaxID=1141098 RepID=A0A1Y2DTG2_9PEZI|nr:uncharacterized protein BCR38DRAFT_239728 [Pseudomassariella vexata]ORY62434.1 hypothetical protein BCR38DRAFT_239728 [Pseudomassariella vexata]
MSALEIPTLDQVHHGYHYDCHYTQPYPDTRCPDVNYFGTWVPTDPQVKTGEICGRGNQDEMAHTRMVLAASLRLLFKNENLDDEARRRKEEKSKIWDKKALEFRLSPEFQRNLQYMRDRRAMTARMDTAPCDGALHTIGAWPLWNMPMDNAGIFNGGIRSRPHPNAFMFNNLSAGEKDRKLSVLTETGTLDALVDTGSSTSCATLEVLRDHFPSAYLVQCNEEIIESLPFHAPSLSAKWRARIRVKIVDYHGKGWDFTLDVLVYEDLPAALLFGSHFLRSSQLHVR